MGRGRPSRVRRAQRSAQRPFPVTMKDMAGRSSPAGLWLLEVLCWVLIPAVVLWLLIGVSRDLGPAWDAAHGVGQVGTFTVEHATCGRTVCAYMGRFSSSDGAVHLQNVGIAESGVRLDQGQKVPVVHPPGAPAMVFLAHGSRAWIVDLVWFSGFFLALVRYGWVLAVARPGRWRVPTHQPEPRHGRPRSVAKVP